MNILTDILKELGGMFISDARLSGAVLLVIGATAALIDLVGLDPLLAGTLLLIACLFLVIESVRRSARKAHRHVKRGLGSMGDAQ